MRHERFSFVCDRADQNTDIYIQAEIIADALTRSGQTPAVCQTSPSSEETMLDGGRIGPILLSQEAGLRIWRRRPGGVEEMIVWVDGKDRPVAEVLARCMLAVDAPIPVRGVGERLVCTLAAVTALTGFDDRSFEKAARTVSRGAA